MHLACVRYMHVLEKPWHDRYLSWRCAKTYCFAVLGLFNASVLQFCDQNSDFNSRPRLDAYMTIEFYDEICYASYIKVNMTSVSSIPDQTSSLEYLIVPDDLNTLFKGSDYTVITLKQRLL
jgi:hypothetical protein